MNVLVGPCVIRISGITIKGADANDDVITNTSLRNEMELEPKLVVAAALKSIQAL